jgi:hypothetical protein
MWRKSTIAGFTLVALTAGLLSDNSAQGEIPSPNQLQFAQRELATVATQSSPPARRNRNFRQFRPIARADLLESSVQQSKTTVEQIFNREFTKRMLSHYQSSVQPHEKRAMDPYRRASKHEMQQYFDSRRGMARWTAKEALNTQLKEFFRKSNRDSAPMQVLSVFKDIGQHDQQEAQKLSPEQKIARAHRLDLPKQEEEDVIPTRLRTKLNLIYGRGQLNFQNPIVQTAVNVDVSGPNESLTLDMNKDFKKLTLRTRASYGVEKKLLTFNLNKKITDKIYLDLDSARRTGGGNSSESTARRNESARLTYSVSF